MSGRLPRRVHCCAQIDYLAVSHTTADAPTWEQCGWTELSVTETRPHWFHSKAGVTTVSSRPSKSLLSMAIPESTILINNSVSQLCITPAGSETTPPSNCDVVVMHRCDGLAVAVRLSCPSI